MTATAAGVVLPLLAGVPEGGATVMDNAQQEAIIAGVGACVKSFEGSERAPIPNGYFFKAYSRT